MYSHRRETENVRREGDRRRRHKEIPTAPRTTFQQSGDIPQSDPPGQTPLHPHTHISEKKNERARRRKRQSTNPGELHGPLMVK